MPTVINEPRGSSSSYGVTTPPTKEPGQEIKIYATIQKRDKDTDHSILAFVRDASADPTVKSGFAMYIYINTGWFKILEQEMLDVVIPPTIKEYTTITARNSDQNPGKFAFVLDTTGDSNITSHCPMLYRQSSNGWVQMFKETAMYVES